MTKSTDLASYVLVLTNFLNYSVHKYIVNKGCGGVARARGGTPAPCSDFN
jgi:hypothetical protein